MYRGNESYEEWRDTVWNKYRHHADESPEDIFERVAEAYYPPMKDVFIEDNKATYRVIPGGRVLYAAGKEGASPYNCSVLPSPEDSMEGIFDLAKRMALAFKSGLGVGIDISTLRPEGAPVSKGSAKESTGAWSWAELYSVVTGLVGQANRRGALLISMDITHPDILKFIRMKHDMYTEHKNFLYQMGITEDDPMFNDYAYLLSRLQVRYANISVKITDEFIRAVMYDNEYLQEFISYREDGSIAVDIKHKVRAREIWDTMIDTMYESSEPGILFIDRLRESNLLGDEYAPVTTNPCGEVPLPEWGMCNLISVNLPAHLIRAANGNYDIDTSKLEETVRYAVRFADALIDNAYYPFEEFKKRALLLRKVGLGIMGLADVFLFKGMRYGSLESIELTDTLMQFIANVAFDESAELARQHGPAPAISTYKDKHGYSDYSFLVENSSAVTYRLENDVRDKIKQYGLRNTNLISVAPTGSISILAGVSSAFEPVFYLEMERWSDSFKKMVRYEHPAYTELKRLGVIKNDEKPDWLVTAEEIDPLDKLHVHAAIQKWTDLSVSNTYVLSNTVSKEDLEKFILKGWEMGVKGLTIYRSGTRGSIIRKSDESKKVNEESSVYVKNNAGDSGIRISSDIKYHRPFSLDCVSYRFLGDGKNIYINIAGEDNNPLEVFFGSKSIYPQDFIIALNTVISMYLKDMYVLSKSIGNDIYERALDNIISELREVRSGAPIFFLGKKINSMVGFWAEALELYRKNMKPEDILKVRVDMSSLYSASDVSRHDKSIIDLYPSGLMNPPQDDAVFVKCPSCGAIIWTKEYPFEFDCNYPCPNCGYSEKCE